MQRIYLFMYLSVVLGHIYTRIHRYSCANLSIILSISSYVILESQALSLSLSLCLSVCLSLSLSLSLLYSPPFRKDKIASWNIHDEDCCGVKCWKNSPRKQFPLLSDRLCWVFLSSVFSGSSSM